MADSTGEPEPSMEEILEMIRRNITDDGRARAARIFGGRPNRDALDLTEAIADDGTVHHIDPATTPGDRRVEPAPIGTAAGGASPAPARDGLRSDGGGRTLEEFVADLLRPMLREWLDENLPALVERLARAELARRPRD